MSLQDVMSGGNATDQSANPTNPNPDSSGGKGAAQTPNPTSLKSALSGGNGDNAAKATVTLPTWATQVSKEYRENPEYAGKLAAFEKLDDLVKGYFDAQGKSGIPGADAKPEELAAFWKKLGHPEKPDGYTVAKDQNTETFISAAHAARLTDGQATALWKEVSESAARQTAAAQSAQAAEMAATDAALKKEYGDQYEYALEMFKRGIGSGEVRTLITRAGLAGRPEIVKAFIALGASTQESGSPKSGDVPGKGKDFMNDPWYKNKEK
jgi:hypothetical protein